MKHLKEIKDWKEMINEVVCGDCLEGMKLIPDKSIDLVLTDPPYGISWHKTGFKNQKMLYEKYKKALDEWDKKPTKEYWEEIRRISKEQFICGINYFNEYFKNFTPIVWDKKNGDSMMADGELLGTTIKGKLRIFRHAYIGRYNPEPVRQHPTQKPVELMRWILENYSKEGDLICDPFMGSWTTARACKDLGRDFIGFEISEEYCKIGEERLKQEVMF